LYVEFPFVAVGGRARSRFGDVEAPVPRLFVRCLRLSSVSLENLSLSKSFHTFDSNFSAVLQLYSLGVPVVVVKHHNPLIASHELIFCLHTWPIVSNLHQDTLSESWFIAPHEEPHLSASWSHKSGPQQQQNTHPTTIFNTHTLQHYGSLQYTITCGIFCFK
jgi:hypothetical protein